MPAEYRAFDDLLEPLVYWDTTFAIAYIEDTALFHDECRGFADRLERESILSVSSDFVHNEVAFHIFKTALAAEGNRTGRYWFDATLSSFANRRIPYRYRIGIWRDHFCYFRH